jgi:hypothetical protein
VYRLIYKSESTVPMNWQTVGKILAISTRNNDRDGLTGTLMVGRKSFLQVLEGSFEAVNATFARIVSDPRHCRVQLVSFEVIEERLFDEWQMRGVGLFEFDPPVSRSLMDKYGEENGNIRFPEVGWQALSLIRDIFALDDVPEWKESDPD